jgi:quercetin dioxygenase-like cupin family protein
VTYLVTRSDEGQLILAGPSVSAVKVSGSVTEDRASVIEMTLDAAWQGPPPHIHNEIDHVWYVVNGRVRARFGDDEIELSPGDVAWVAHGQPHSFATGAEQATMLQIDTPRALDAYFWDLADAFPRGTRPDARLVGEIMARHDTHLIHDS